MTERITAHAEDDWECLCGNTAMSDGFWPCLPDGTEVEPTLEGPWDGKLVVCHSCGRIMDQSTFSDAERTVLVVRGPSG
jgi:hypothetical protein